MSTEQTKPEPIQVEPRLAMRFSNYLKDAGNGTFGKTISNLVGEQMGAGAEVVTFDKKTHIDTYKFYLIHKE
jgi:hypothetical protein